MNEEEKKRTEALTEEMRAYVLRLEDDGDTSAGRAAYERLMTRVSPKDAEKIRAYERKGQFQREKLYDFCSSPHTASHFSSHGPRPHVDRKNVFSNWQSHPSKTSYSTAQQSFTDDEIEQLKKFVEREEKCPSFLTVFGDFLERSGRKASEVYHEAGMDRHTFHRLMKRGRKNKIPKPQVWGLALGLRLNLDDALRLLDSAEHSAHSTFDAVLKFAVQKGEYRIPCVNIWLYEMHQPLIEYAPEEAPKGD